ncbi:hypothetical protein E4U22_000149 [Claviceps purpurea]|nr:hypothetical protein E4U22_000149 [Claviceps purpurea]
MVQILPLVITALVAMSPVAQAAGCVNGRIYCGHTLQTYGKETTLLSRRRICLSSSTKMLPILGYEGAASLVPSTLYQCGTAGSLTRLRNCTRACVDGGAGKHDFCAGLLDDQK